MMKMSIFGENKNLFDNSGYMSDTENYKKLISNFKYETDDNSTQIYSILMKK